MRKAIIILPLVLTFALLLAQCAPSEPVAMVEMEETEREQAITIGYGAPALDAGQVAIMRGLVDQAEAKEWEVVTSNANSDSQTQADQIDYFVSMGVDAIVVVPVDSQGICESVERANEAGIPFYTIDRAPIGCQVNLTVLSNNYIAGVQAGETMVELLIERYDEPRGIILELEGDPNTNVAVLRHEGFHSIVGQYPDIAVISRSTGWQAAQFASITQQIASDVNIDGIYLHADGIGIPVVLPILEQLDKKIPCGEPDHIFITGVGGSPAGLQAIRDGYSDQTSAQPLYDFGIISDWIQKELNGEQIEAGEVRETGALWSPATVERGETGWQLLLSTISVTVDNVDEPTLWGNQSITDE